MYLQGEDTGEDPVNKNALEKYRGLGGRNKAQKKTNDWKMV